MWDLLIVLVILAVAVGYTVYRLFLRPSCGCGSTGCHAGKKKKGCCSGKKLEK